MHMFQTLADDESESEITMNMVYLGLFQFQIGGFSKNYKEL